MANAQNITAAWTSHGAEIAITPTTESRIEYFTSPHDYSDVCP